MEDKIIIWPVIIKHTKDSDYPYFARIPDIDGMTEGKDITDAKNIAMDYIGTYLLVHDLPKSNTTLPKQIDKNDITTLVTVNISEYRRKNKQFK